MRRALAVLLLLACAALAPAAHRVRDYIGFVPVFGVYPAPMQPAPAPGASPGAPTAAPAGPQAAEESVEGLPAVRGYAPGVRAVRAAPVTAIDPARVESVLGSCVRCHTQGSEKGKVVLFGPDGRFAPAVSATAIYQAVASGEMPKDGPKPTPQDVELLRQWSATK